MKHDLSQDFFGASYDVVISRLHEVLKPQSYLEIGVCHGHTLQFSKSETIAIDPRFDFNDMNAVRNFTTNKNALLLFQMTSDSFLPNTRQQPSSVGL